MDEKSPGRATGETTVEASCLTECERDEVDELLEGHNPIFRARVMAVIRAAVRTEAQETPS